MDERNKKLVEAAQTVFARYGVSKTTMNDIAREAGVARQTLYNAYPSKEAVLRATLRHAADHAMDAVSSAWREQTSLCDKLETYFRLGPLNWYDIIQVSPEAADLIDGIHTIAKHEMIEIAKLWNVMFETVIREHAVEGGVAHHNAAATAEFIFSASMNAKTNATDRSVVVTRLNILKLAVLSLVERPEMDIS